MQQRIIRNGRKKRDAVSGFTLIEALVAIALMGVILAALTSITSQWLPNWNRGIARAQRSELVSVALERLIADIGASEFIPPNRDAKGPLFDGTEFSVTLVRSAIGPNTRPGLEIVRISQIDDKGGQVLVRTTKPFAPVALTTTALQQIGFCQPDRSLTVAIPRFVRLCRTRQSLEKELAERQSVTRSRSIDGS